MEATTQTHWDIAVYIVKYLKGVLEKGILYANRGNVNIEASLDAGWGGSPNDMRSTMEYCVFLGGSLISLKIKKRSVVTH